MYRNAQVLRKIWNCTNQIIIIYLDKVDFLVQISGFPSPKISWRRKDGILLPTGKESHTSSKMVISKARREDRGNF